MGELDGKVTVITGAGSGIGRGIALVLARRGADLILTDLDQGRAQAVADEVGGTALEHDVTSWQSCARVVEKALELRRRIDVLVNNAGVSKSLPFHELDEKEWDRVNDVNAKACSCVAARSSRT
jgi:meso-butanediol dehydrogenase / (S,S)-butanediol dehydrogenase / diacetyl reductase